MTDTATIKKAAPALPSQADHEQAGTALMKCHDAVERIIWQLQDVASRYAENGAMPAGGVPTLTDVGALYEFMTSVEVRAEELASFTGKLKELLEDVAAMSRDGALRERGA